MNTSLLKILITGGNGQLAHALSNHKRNREFQLISCVKEDLDITNLESIQNALTKYQPDLIINTAAYTAVDKAESEIEAANLINSQGAANLASACDKQKIPLIHLSTDYVFDGKKTSPYTEEDTANPINVYGKSKLLGEEAVRKYCPQHIILRVSGVFSEYGNNFFNTMLRLAKNKIPLRVVADQFTCPTYAGDIAEALFQLAKKCHRWGTYHFCSSPPTSWHDFAEEILGFKIQAITTAEYPTAAKRPVYSVLNCEKIAADYGIKQPSWKQAVQKLV